jgi:hypothetical protein
MFSRKPLRIGNFGALLETLGYDFDDAIDAATTSKTPKTNSTWRGSDQIQYVFDRITETHSYVPTDRLTKAYGEVPFANPEPPPRPPNPPRTQLSEAEAVAQELNLASARSVAEIKRSRRNFALRNHPDRVSPAKREEATRRMTIANTLIDRALKERALPRRA